MRFLKRQKSIIIGILVLAVCAVTWHVWLKSTKEKPVTDEYVWNSTLEPEYIEYNGLKYTLNPAVETVLLGGVDSDNKIDLSGGNGSGGQVDALFLLVIDSNKKTVDTIQINRDTMTAVKILNDNYNADGTTVTQIALSHAYGNGGSISCNNTVAAVEDLLFGIEIDKYMFMNMGAIPVLNDFFGGIEVNIEDDFSSIDPTLVRGEKIRLNGSQAYNFLRARKNVDDSGNENRMKRHRIYVDSLIETAMGSIGSSESTVMDLYNHIYDYTATSLSASEMTSLVAKTRDYTHNDIIVPEGEFSMINELVEFYPNDEKLKETVIEMFYIPLTAETETE